MAAHGINFVRSVLDVVDEEVPIHDAYFTASHYVGGKFSVLHLSAMESIS